MTKIIDTHAHYYHKLLNRNLDKLMREMSGTVSTIINIGTNNFSNRKVLAMAREYNMFYS